MLVLAQVFTRGHNGVMKETPAGSSGCEICRQMTGKFQMEKYQGKLVRENKQTNNTQTHPSVQDPTEGEGKIYLQSLW